MEKRNITLSISKELLLRVKLIAVQRHTSVSGLLTQTLERGWSSKKMPMTVCDGVICNGSNGEPTWGPAASS